MPCEIQWVCFAMGWKLGLPADCRQLTGGLGVRGCLKHLSRQLCDITSRHVQEVMSDHQGNSDFHSISLLLWA